MITRIRRVDPDQVAADAHDLILRGGDGVLGHRPIVPLPKSSHPASVHHGEK
jgi:hypothetical protein